MPDDPRLIIPEILDSLDPEDPRAIRSRHDLLLVNAFLGNSRWILSQLKKLTENHQDVFELGAGEGSLCAEIQSARSEASVTGLDFLPRPRGLDLNIGWQSGDFFDTLAGVDGGICVGSLILHHFSSGRIRELGARLQGFSTLIFCEPHRSRFPLALARLAWCFSGEVTRHDMPASIRAGFRQGELPSLLGLHPDQWKVQESLFLGSSLRMVASRR